MNKIRKYHQDYTGYLNQLLADPTIDAAQKKEIRKLHTTMKNNAGRVTAIELISETWMF